MAKENVKDGLSKLSKMKKTNHIQEYMEKSKENSNNIIEKKAGRKPSRGEKATKQVPMYLTEKDYKKLKTISFNKEKTPGQFVKEIFLEYLDKQEEI
jgi:hypothetical protein